ncbi:MAG: acylphosphatase [ANME-2 cluster archaeon]|nr:MAG: acylphosphatase [ANME-2 cluster archaeon]
MNNARVHLFISGKVQGVFFRQNTFIRARELALSGWVKNLSDGRVEVVIEGTQEHVYEMVGWCRIGKPRAKVTDVDEIWEEPCGEFDSFEIIY